MTTDLSIIIVTYNPGDILRSCLDSLTSASSTLTSQAIIVDNNSTDESLTRIIPEFPHILVIRNKDNRGFAAANNQGIAKAEGRYTVLLNPDVIVRNNALSKMVTFMDAHPQVGVLGPRTFDAEGRISITAHGPYTPRTILWRYLGIDRVFPYMSYGAYRRASEQAREAFEATWVQGSCMVIRREVVEQIGGLDEDFFLFCEEPDFCERAARQGWRTMVLPDAEVEHHESTTISRYPLVKMRQYHRSPLIYFKKRRRHADILILKTGFVLELLLKFSLRLLQLKWLFDERAAARLRAFPVVIGEVLRF